MLLVGDGHRSSILITLMEGAEPLDMLGKLRSLSPDTLPDGETERGAWNGETMPGASRAEASRRARAPGALFPAKAPCRSGACS